MSSELSAWVMWRYSWIAIRTKGPELWDAGTLPPSPQRALKLIANLNPGYTMKGIHSFLAKPSQQYQECRDCKVRTPHLCLKCGYCYLCHAKIQSPSRQMRLTFAWKAVPSYNLRVIKVDRGLWWEGQPYSQAVKQDKHDFLRPSDRIVLQRIKHCFAGH